MIRVGTLDHPVERSSHTTPTPKGGGVGIVAGFACGIVFVHWQGGAPGSHPVWVVAAALLLGAVSYFDDQFDWPFLAKLGAQAVAAIFVISSGDVLSHLALPDGHVLILAPRGLLAQGLTLAWFLFVTNAVNFMDGLNGLASGCVALAMVVAALGAGTSASVQAALLVAAIAGFLPFNYPRARIFMGDVGSQVCGFLAADIVLLNAPQPSVSLAAPLALLPLLLDAGFTLARRALNGDRLTQAHRGHLYQVAHRAGVPAWSVTLAYWALTSWGGLLGLAAGAWPCRGWYLAMVVAIAVIPSSVCGLAVARKAKRVGLTTW